MKADGRNTYWGTDFRNDSDPKVRKLLGENLELQTPGSDARKSEERQAAFDILEDPDVAHLNARQIMLKHKAAHGSRSNLDFPDQNEIQKNMTGYHERYKVEIYGDGSYTTPTIWWAALGGYGIWMPRWACPNQVTDNDQTGPPQQHEQQRPHLL